MSTRREPAMRAVSIILVGLGVLCLIPDPYSYGGIGGDRNIFHTHLWQQVVTAGLVALSLVGLLQKKHDRALRFFALETLLFVVLNLVYITRDGPDIRFTLGNVGSRLPLLLVAAGVIFRITHIIMLIAKARQDKAVTSKRPVF